MWRRVVAVIVTVVAVTGLGRLTVPVTGDGEPAGVRRQLTFLRAELDDGAGEAAQALFPEGYFFLHELYGLTWVELAMRVPGHRAEALREARWALARLDSPAGTAPYDPALTPAYGVFHRGWMTWLRGGGPAGSGDGPAAAPRRPGDRRRPGGRPGLRHAGPRARPGR